MKFISKRLAAAAAAVAMLAAPVAVSAQTAAEPQTAPADAPATPDSGPDGAIAEGSTATLINIGILAALVVGVLVATGGDDDDAPDSP